MASAAVDRAAARRGDRRVLDARVQDLLRQAARCGLKPRDDVELLPVLLQVVDPSQVHEVG